MTQTWVGGFHAVQALLENDAAKTGAVLLAQERHDKRAKALKATAATAGVSVRLVPRYELDMLAPGLRHQGVLAALASAAEAPAGEDFLHTPATPAGLLLALDGVTDPHNLGACLRTAEAAGVDAVIVPRDRAAGLTPVTRKAAAGAAERVPLVAVTNLSRSLTDLKTLGYWVLGLAGEGGESLYTVDMSGPLVVVAGAEGAGLRRLTREYCDRLLKIPMQGGIESLNVSVATAVCLYEVVRQRGAPG